MEITSGQTIKGYELRERIGTGGFGAVYRAYQSTVEREVAIKIILPGFANHPDFIRRFETEARLVARLEHPFIIPLHDFWRDPDGAYLVMRWLRGGNLRDALKEGAFDLPAAAMLLDQIAAGLSFAHRNQVIHRDLKPPNILLDEDGNAYLADFGIAKDIGDLKEHMTQPDAIVGSFDYLSPEQARSEPVTPQTDIYGLGVVLYEALAQQHPFPNMTPVERLYKHLNDPLPRIETLPVAVRDAINAVIQKATAKNPANRYGDALELAAAFREAAGLARSQNADRLVEMLTQREQEVLLRLVDGLSNKEIARELFVTVTTVKWYIKQIYGKLRVRSRVQAIIRARELKLIVGGNDSYEKVEGAQNTYLAESENPYKGLRAFQSADYQDFWGREKLTQKLLKRIAETGGSGRFLAVIGPSGSGKSSLVKAGLIPALWRGDLPGAEKWFVVEIVPGMHPVEALEIGLTRVAANQAGNLREHLDRDMRGLLRAANLILPQDDTELVLVIDQFEELFTLVEDEKARSHFLDLLNTAVTDSRSRVCVVIMLRADFYDRPLHYPHFGELVRSHMETILPLSAEELERSIVKPAERVGVRFEEGLVAKIVGEVNYQPGALPLLQYALTELFEQRQGRLLTHDAYQSIGGTVGALAKRAEEIYAGLDDAGKEAVRQMFLRLVTLGEGVEDTRRRVPRAELMAITATPELIDEVIDTFAAYRLLSLDNDPGTRSPTVELAHEALIRAWERLREWVMDYRDEIKLQRQVGAMAEEWQAAARDVSFLVRGIRLDHLTEWAKTTRLALTGTEAAFLEASIAARVAEAEAETARVAKEQALERRSINRLRGLVAILIAAIIGVSLLLLLIGIQANSEREARAQAEANEAAALFARATSEANLQRAEALRLASDTYSLLPGSLDNAEIAALLAIRSLNIVYSPQANDALLDAARLLYGEAIYPRPYASSEVLFYSFPRWLPGGLSSLIVTQNHTVERYNLETATSTTLVSDTGNPIIAEFSPNGELALIGFADGNTRVYNLGTGALMLTLNGQSSPVTSLAMSDDENTIATAGEDRTLWLWDAVSGDLRQTLSLTDLVWGWMDFSPDNRYLAVPKIDNSLDVIDVQSGEILQQMGGGLDRLETAVFSPDGSMVLTASSDGSARLWNPVTGAEIRTFSGHQAAVASAYFSPDARYVLTASRDGTARMWDINTGEEVRHFSGHHGGLRYAGFSPDGIQIVTTSPEENTWRVWDAQPGHAFDRVIDPQFGGYYSWGARFSLNGRWMITGFAEKTGLGLYDAQTFEFVRDIDPEGTYIAPFALSPDGRYVLGVADEDRSNIHLLLIELATGEVRQTYVGHEGRILDAAFSPDGQQLITGSEDGTARLWDVASGEQLHLLTHDSGVSAVGFSRDGRSVFTGAYSAGVVYQWDAQSGENIQQFTASAAAIYHLIVSLDGEHVIGGGNGGVTAWNIISGAQIWDYHGAGFSVDIAALAPDGSVLATAGTDGMLRLWNPETGEVLRQLKGFDAVPYSLDFSPDGSRLITNGGNNQLQLWYLNWHDLVSLACTRIFRDLDAEERAAYSITDASPTCPQFEALEE